MPKGVNEKAAAARERKAEAKRGKEASAAAQREDAEWAAAGEGQRTRGAAKRDDAERKKAEAAARRAEAKRLEEAEAAELTRPKGRQKVTQASRVTAYQLALEKEQEAKAAEEKRASSRLAARREVDEDAYGQQLDAFAGNARLGEEASARSVAEAVSVLAATTAAPGIGPRKPEDRHPEKRMKAAYASYCEDRLPALKKEKPGLKQSQYNDMLFKYWQKAPENPMNAAR